MDIEGVLPAINTLEGDTEQVGAGPEPVETTAQFRDTKPERPATGVTVTVEVALPPSETDARGVAERVTWGMNGMEMLVVWVDPPPVPVTVTV